MSRHNNCVMIGWRDGLHHRARQGHSGRATDELCRDGEFFIVTDFL